MQEKVHGSLSQSEEEPHNISRQLGFVNTTSNGKLLRQQKSHRASVRKQELWFLCDLAKLLCTNL